MYRQARQGTILTDIIFALRVYNKGTRIIASCKTLDQLETADRYVDLFDLRVGPLAQQYCDILRRFIQERGTDLRV